ncbi:MAG: hemerythrin domain-containing protein [Bacteroidetes bacterium]|nr:hemerythrin domain-containing protein [Bacteroidota bacterium]
MIDLKQLKDTDPLVRNAEKTLHTEEFSPMDPPDAYAPPGGNAVSRDEMHPVLRHLMDEHEAFVTILDAFETILLQIRENGLTKKTHQGLSGFFRKLDEEIVRHNLKEEKILFPLLQDRLLEVGEHSAGAIPTTAVDMLEDDHSKFIQLAAVSFNFFGLAGRLPDPASAALTLDAALEQSATLVEHLRLHIFRENNVVFPLAQKHISDSEMDGLLLKLENFRAA